jgi:putative ABC transport system permease protein
VFRTTLKGINAHKRRLFGTGMAVVLGVAFLAGTLVLGDTLRAGFGDLLGEVNADTDVVIRSATEMESEVASTRGLLDATLVDDVRAVDGVAAAEPQIEVNGQIVGSDGDPVGGGGGTPTLAGNWVTDPDLNPYDLAEGRAPGAPGEVVIDRASAQAGDLSVGDTTTIRTPEAIEATVVGIATFGSADSAGPVTWAAFTTDYALDVLMPSPGTITGVAVAADEGLSRAQLVDRLGPVVPDGAEALTGEELTADQESALEADFYGFTETLLRVFAGVAIVVASFSIYNTLSILVAQRTHESALLRALGASRRQVLLSTCLEALVVGLVASVLGVAAGGGLAAGLLALMRAATGVDLPTDGLVLTAGTVATGLLVGVLVTLLASVAPAIRASRVRPLAALRDVAVDRSAGSVVRGAAGVVLTGVGAVLTIGGTLGGGSLPMSGAGALLTVVGVVVLGPVVARPAAGVVGSLLTLRGRMPGTLARRNAERNPRRTANTTSALMVGMAVVTLFTVLAASIRLSIDDAISGQFAGDLAIGNTNLNGGMGVDPELATAVSDLPEVDVATGVAMGPMRVDGGNAVATAVEPAELTAVYDIEVAEGSLTRLGDDEVALHEDYAASHGLALGDSVPVTFADGATAEPTLGAIYKGTSNLLQDVILTKAAWTPHWPLRVADTVLLIGVADGVDLDQAERAVQPIADRMGAPEPMDRDEYVESLTGQIDQVLVVIYALLVLAIVIAVMGIANTLSLSVHERTRELGLLRAVGQTRRQLRSMVRGESFVLAVFGTLGGLSLGSFLGWAMFQALAAVEEFGVFAIPLGQLGVVLALGGLVGVAAAVRPARRAARLNVLEAISTE